MLARIAALAVPPAWTEVWICPDPLGHIQATGRDNRGRKRVEAVPSRQGAAGYRFAATMRGGDAGVIRLTPNLVRAAHQCEAAGRAP